MYSTNTDERHELTKFNYLETAFALLEENDTKMLRLMDLAKRLGVPLKQVNFFFETDEELFFKVIEHRICILVGNLYSEIPNLTCGRDMIEYFYKPYLADIKLQEMLCFSQTILSDVANQASLVDHSKNLGIILNELSYELANIFDTDVIEIRNLILTSHDSLMGIFIRSEPPENIGKFKNALSFLFPEYKERSIFVLEKLWDGI